VRWIVGSIVGVVLLVAVVAVVAAVRPRPQSDYDDAVHDRFLGACTAQGGEPVRDTCECLYGEIEQNVPFDRFELLDESLATQTQSTAPDQPLQLPDDVDAMLQDCVTRTASN
jgi:hypothetical protein